MSSSQASDATLRRSRRASETPPLSHQFSFGNTLKLAKKVEPVEVDVYEDAALLEDPSLCSPDLKKIAKGHWSPEEDKLLQKAVKKYEAKNWKKIAEELNGRTDVQCLHRWQKVLNPNLIKGPWTPEEDKLVLLLVEKNGPQKWTSIADNLPG